MSAARNVVATLVGAAVLLVTAAGAVHAQSPEPFANADPEKGQALVDKDCHGCHVRLFGDRDRIYTRADRRVRTLAQLRAQVAYCNAQLGTGYFPDDEEHIAAWLNQRYYRFER